MEKIPKYETKSTPYFLNSYKKWIKDKKERLPDKLKQFNLKKMQKEKMLAEVCDGADRKKHFSFETGKEIYLFIKKELEKLSIDTNLLGQNTREKMLEEYDVQKKYNKIKYHLYCALDNPTKARDDMQERFCKIFESLYVKKEYLYHLEKTENGYELIKTVVNKNE